MFIRDQPTLVRLLQELHGYMVRLAHTFCGYPHLFQSNGILLPHDTEHVRCAIYARSATVPNPEAIEAQIKACRDAARMKGWAVLENYVEVDEGKAGNSAGERPGLQMLLALTKTKPRPP